jgi:hypothetical protein
VFHRPAIHSGRRRLAGLAFLLPAAMLWPGGRGQGIGLATVGVQNDGLTSNYVWLTTGDGSAERDPVLGRLGASVTSDAAAFREVRNVKSSRGARHSSLLPHELL